MIEIHLLGKFELYCSDKPLPLPATRNARSLLAYLVIRKSQAWPRELLADLFWPDRPRERALRSLSTALWHIRRVIPDEDYIWADVATLQFNTDSAYWLDVDAFEAQIHLSPREAIPLYRGDFLEGFFDDWCLGERYRLESLYLGGLEQLARTCETTGQFDEALRYVELLLSQDPLSEVMHSAAIRLHIRLGHRAEAIRQARWYRSVLRDELNAELAPETVALFDELLGAVWQSDAAREHAPRLAAVPRRPPLPLLESPPFVGREREWALLLGLWQETLSGGGRLLLLSGEAGIGKSRLAMQLRQSVQQRGYRAVVGQCYDYERSRPHGPLADIVRALLADDGASLLSRLPRWQVAELARLTPELGQQFPSLAAFRGEAETGQEQERLFDAITFLLLDLARQSPLLLVLEDMQWASDSMLTWLHYLIRQFADAPILLITTWREDAADAGHRWPGLVRKLQQESLTASLTLPRLTHKALAAWMQGASDALVERVYRQTEGNPFFVLETLRTLFENDQVTFQEDRWIEQRGESIFPIPASVKQAIQMRLQRFSAPEREALAIAAVIGRVFDLGVLEQAWGKGEEATLRALDAFLRRGVIHEGSGLSDLDYEFDHHLIQEVIYRDLHYRRRQRYHRLVARAILAQNPAPEAVAADLAYHFQQGGEPLLALPHLVQAGQNAADSDAYDEAVAFWEQAWEHFSTLPSDASGAYRALISDSLFKRAELFHLQGKTSARQADVTRLRALAQAADDELLLDQTAVREAHYLNLDGHYAQALERARDVALRCAQRGDADGEARALAEWGFVHYFRGEYQQAMERLEQALSLSLQDQEARGAVLSALSYVYYLISDYRQSLDYRRQALEIRTRLGRQARVAEDLTDMGILYLRLHQPERALDFLNQALQLSREIGSQPAESYALNHLGNLHYVYGRYPQAIERYQQSLVLQRATGSRRGEASVLGNLGKVMSILGDYEKAEAFLRESLAIQEDINYKSGLAEGLAHLARLLIQTGRMGEARDEIARALAIAQRIGDRYCQIMALNVLARWHLAQNEAVQARTAAQKAVVRARAIDLWDGQILGLTLAARAQLALLQPEAALEQSAQAVALLEQVGCFEGMMAEVYAIHHQAVLAVESSGKTKSDGR